MCASKLFVANIALFLLFFTGLAPADGGEGRLVGSAEDGWPQFRGPYRNGLSGETGLLQAWPEGGPRRIWTVSGLGRGYSSPIITNGALYITGDVEDDLVVFAYDLDGNIKWKIKNGKAWKGPYPAARASCTFDGGRLYHMNAHGRVVCLDPADGGEIWAVNILERFGGENIRWGKSECLLVDGDRVFVTPGGKKTLVAALDKKTGDTLWASEPLRFTRTMAMGGMPVDPPKPDTDKAGYAPLILFETGGRRLIAGCSARHFFCVDAEGGEILWTRQMPVQHEVIGAIPIFWQNTLFFTAPRLSGHLYKVRANEKEVQIEPVWETPLDNCHGALVLVDGRLYGSGYNNFKDWACLDAGTGEMLYTAGGMAIGSAVHADHRLYALTQEGQVRLLEPTPDGFRTRGQFTLVEPPRKKDVWPHPVICDGRLYLRYHENLFCFDIRK